MKMLIFVWLQLVVVLAHADGKLVLDGKAYALVELERQKCFDVGSPEYLAQQVTLDFAQRNGEATAMALCAVMPKYCERNEQVRFSIKQVFVFVRALPARFKSTGCAALRDECKLKCESTNLFRNQECFVECNQYEN